MKEETKLKISDTLTGRPHTEERKEKARKSCKEKMTIIKL